MRKREADRRREPKKGIVDLMTSYGERCGAGRKTVTFERGFVVPDELVAEDDVRMGKG